MEWLTNIVYPVLGLALGSGGIAAVYKARKDSQLGIRSAETAEDTAQSERWKNLIEVQTKSLLEPLTAQVSSLSGQVASLQVEVRKLEMERTEWHRERYLYWAYAHDLIDWINDEKGPPAPEPPTGLEFK